MAQNIEEKNTVLNDKKKLRKTVSELKDKVTGQHHCRELRILFGMHWLYKLQNLDLI